MCCTLHRLNVLSQQVKEDMALGIKEEWVG